ncbi:MAG TPA: DNA-binding protein, partial [Synergistales bacterium]|nr:DNA-binding protein [Synergistales bacterium]
MIVERNKNLIALRFDDGEDVIPRLYEALGDTTSAILISAVGMLRDFEIGWLGPEGYEKKRFHEPC